MSRGGSQARRLCLSIVVRIVVRSNGSKQDGRGEGTERSEAVNGSNSSGRRVPVCYRSSRHGPGACRKKSACRGAGERDIVRKRFRWSRRGTGELLRSGQAGPKEGLCRKGTWAKAERSGGTSQKSTRRRDGDRDRTDGEVTMRDPVEEGGEVNERLGEQKGRLREGAFKPAD
jgi:hypothetical protein